MSLNINGNILNDIHPNTKEPEKKSEVDINTKPIYFGIPENILDGIHSKVQTSFQYDKNKEQAGAGVVPSSSSARS